MTCINHPNVAAVGRCSGCAESFCANCLLEMQGQSWCGSCKQLAVGSVPAAAAPGTGELCKEAKEALIYSIVGLFCFGIILEPIALIKATKAKKLLAADPTLSGGGMATAAMIIAIIGLAVWILGMIGRFAV